MYICLYIYIYKYIYVCTYTYTYVFQWFLSPSLKKDVERHALLSKAGHAEESLLPKLPSPKDHDKVI